MPRAARERSWLWCFVSFFGSSFFSHPEGCYCYRFWRVTGLGTPRSRRPPMLTESITFQSTFCYQLSAGVNIDFLTLSRELRTKQSSRIYEIGTLAVIIETQCP